MRLLFCLGYTMWPHLALSRPAHQAQMLTPPLPFLQVACPEPVSMSVLLCTGLAALLLGSGLMWPEGRCRTSMDQYSQGPVQ